VRKRGDLIILESGSEDDPVAHARLRRVTSQWWTLEMGITGKWSALPPGHKAGKEMLVREVSMLIKLAQSLEE
jgi:hypothetical protein